MSTVTPLFSLFHSSADRAMRKQANMKLVLLRSSNSGPSHIAQRLRAARWVGLRPLFALKLRPYSGNS